MKRTGETPVPLCDRPFDISRLYVFFARIKKIEIMPVVLPFRHFLLCQWLLLATSLIVPWVTMTIAEEKPAESSTPEPKRIVVLGDSLAAGYQLDPSEGFPALLQKKIEAAKWNY